MDSSSTISIIGILFVVIIVGTSWLSNSGYSQLKVSKFPIPAPTSTLKAVVTIFGIKNSTDNLLVFVQAKNTTVAKLFDAPQTDKEEVGNRSGDGVVDLSFIFPPLNLKTGESFKACAIVLNELHSVCQNGYKYGSDRIERVSLSVGIS